MMATRILNKQNRKALANLKDEEEPVSSGGTLGAALGQLENHDEGDGASRQHSLNSSPKIEQDGVHRESPPRRQCNRGASGSKTSLILSKLPDWVKERLTVRDFLILFRASLAVWASFLFVVIDPILRNFGAEAFMGMLCLFINPASVVIPFYTLAASTILIGIFLAWAWGTISSLAALSCRDDESYNTTYNAILLAASQSPHPSFYAQRQIFNGELLQTPVTVVMFVMCNIFVYFVARLRAAFPKFILVYIFGMIVIDVYITTTPLVNNFRGLLPLIFVKPLTGSIAIGLVLSLLVFPESCSYATLATLSKSLGYTREILKLTRSMLQGSIINQPIPVAEIQALKRKTIGLHTLAEQGFTFIAIEPSIGRWSGNDIKSLQQKFEDLFIHEVILLNFHLLRQEYRSRIHRNSAGDPVVLHPYSDSLESNYSSRQHSGDQHPRTQTLASATIYDFLRPDPENAKLEQEAFDGMGNLSQELLNAEAVDAAIEILETINNRKWFSSAKKSNLNSLVERHVQALAELKAERENFHLQIVDKMVDPTSHLFDAEGRFIPSSDGGLKILSLVVGMNYKHRIMAFTASLISLLERLIQLESERSEVKLWMPIALRSLLSLAFDPEPEYDDNALQKTGTIFDQAEEGPKGENQNEEKGKSVEGRTKMKTAKHYSQGYQRKRPRKKMVQVLTSLYHWITNSDGVFAARVVAATVILTVPGATKAGAKFCYDNRG
ncbi:hypothetical protein TWF718_000387 [Orbilia javanica]|uniref:Putative ER transporter 6TM N-terminal domain-containing protein n=1 Tax=Orbilia javanica TaxID=47235 RepID=A0AAN8NF97_9PEZI